jgi:hypothetical protein
MKSQTVKRISLVLIVLSFFAVVPWMAFAETDVTGKVELIKSGLVYDRRTLTSSMNVTVKNISQDVLLTPIKVVIDSISTADVTISNADGKTSDGKPYYQFDVVDIVDGQLDVSEQISQKTIFKNSLNKRFTYNMKILASLPTPDIAIIRATEALENKNKNEFFVNLSESERQYFIKKYDTLPEEALNYLAQAIKEAVLVEETGQYRKYEAKIKMHTGEVFTTHFSMIFENSAWRLAEL